jgi:hypothetical protein
MTIKGDLETNNIETWIFEEDLPFSGLIASRVREEIEQTDHLLVILSQQACKSKWVAWELGYALQLRALRGECYPSIIGVLRENTPVPYAIQPLAFGGDEPTGPIYTFSDVRNHTICNAYEVAQLVTQLKPKVTFISRTDGREGELLRESFKCYEKLFPDSAERNAPNDIQAWIDESRLGVHHIPWRDVYAVLHMSELVVGMAYFKAYPAVHWSFGSYFGVRRLWRSNNGITAEWFIEQIDRRLLEIDPNTKGAIWETEKVDLPLLNEVVRRGRIGGYPDTPQALASFRRLRRLNLYHRYGVPALLAADGQALPYWQPAMDDSLLPENEREMILMIRLSANRKLVDVQLGELLDFVYNHLYADAYGGTGTISIPGYSRYLASIRQRVERAAEAGWGLGKLRFRGPIRTLLQLAEREDLVRELDL